MKNANTAYGTRIGNAVYVHIDVVASARDTVANTSITRILVTVALTFDKEFDFSFPCLLTGRNDTVYCYYRRSKSEMITKTVSLTDQNAELNQLFPFGLHADLKLSEDDTGVQST